MDNDIYRNPYPAMLTISNILVPRDFSPVSDRALRQALVLAAHRGATIHVLHAEVPYAAERREKYESDPTAGIEELRDALHRAGAVSEAALNAVTVTGAVRRDVAAAPSILRYAADEGVDLIALGTHGRRGASRILLGSVAEEVVRRADRPVLTVRGEDESVSGVIRRILVPVDFSKYARNATRVAKEWAALYGAKVDLLHVVEETLHPAFYVGGVQSVYDADPNIEEKVRKRLTTIAEEVGGPDVPTEVHVKGPGTAAPVVAEFVDEHDVDLVTMSTHGRTGLERFFLGSVAEKVVRHVSCPVLTVKAFGRSLVAADTEEEHAAQA